MQITCVDMAQFIEVISMLVRKGLTFEAYGYDLTIKLTGGY